jgi:hypothetical protein
MESDRKYWTEQTKDGDYSSVTMGIAPYVSAVLDRKAVREATIPGSKK